MTDRPPLYLSLPPKSDKKFWRAYDWYRKRGHRATNALDLAMAERIAETRDWEVDWLWEEDDCGLEEGEVREGDEVLWARLFSAKEEDDRSETLASLGCIIISPDDRDYRREVEAELAMEAISQIRRGARPRRNARRRAG